VWAPKVTRLAVKAGPDLYPMVRRDDDVFETIVTAPVTDYTYVLVGAKERPDPVSRWQPYGVHGASRVVDPFDWTDYEWKGIPLEDYIIYELHVGAFAGTFKGVIDRLPYLRDLGVTAVELMPVAEFPGARNWGYDGVHWYAPQSTYGGPEGLKKLVDACHRHGLAAILDVVYNHLGPEGNYLGDFAPYFSSRYSTPWGDAINYDGPDSDGVRRHVVDNALYWQTEYHFDALRLDAIHGIFDFSAKHILQDIAEASIGYLIAESDLNDARIFDYGIDAQWNDDFHHALYALLTGERHDYFADFGTLDHLKKAIDVGFVYDGRYSKFRRRRHGNSSARLPKDRLVAFIQNHDQVGNASIGRRLTGERLKLGTQVLMYAPNLPLLFMGQEYGETAPFHYFTSHSDAALAEAVRRGRGPNYPDPQDPATFERSKLTWRVDDEMLRFTRELIALRKTFSNETRVRIEPPRLIVERDGRVLTADFSGD
jgi:maltooligosyltrehalose trehalohydrolase